MLKSINGHASATFLQEYLEKRTYGKSRAIAKDFVNLRHPDWQRAWAHFMDKTRRQEGNDMPWGKKRAITYKHFILSPDPADNCDLETLQDLTCAWVQEFFGTNINKGGLLGNYEVAVIYHNDNAKAIPHAHIVVNNTDLKTGRRLQINNRDVGRLSKRLQELSKERGLSAFASAADKTRALEPNLKVRRTAAERAILKAHKFSWKQHLRDVIDIAVRTSTTKEEFYEVVDKYGVKIESTEKGAWMLSHPANPKRWCVNGEKLGQSYKPLAVEHRIKTVSDVQKQDRLAIRKNLVDNVEPIKRNVLPEFKSEREMLTNKTKIGDVIYGWTVVAIVDKKQTVPIANIARCLRYNEKYGITCERDYKLKLREISRLKRQHTDKKTGKIDEKVKRELNMQYGKCKDAQRTAEKASIFRGVSGRQGSTGLSGEKAVATATKRKQSNARSAARKQFRQQQNVRQRTSSRSSYVRMNRKGR